MPWNKLKSLFVVSDAPEGASSPATPPEESFELPAQDAPAPLPEGANQATIGPDMDFQALYDLAGIPNTDEVEALERFLAGLDDSLPQAAKLAAAKAFLNAISKSPADVLKDAARKIAVVRAVADSKREDVEKAAAQKQAAIAALQKEMDTHRAAIEALNRDLEAVRARCATEEGRLQGARVFFGAVGDVKQQP